MVCENSSLAITEQLGAQTIKSYKKHTNKKYKMSKGSSFEILEMLKQIIQSGPDKMMFYAHAHAHAPRTQIEKTNRKSIKIFWDF